VKRASPRLLACLRKLGWSDQADLHPAVADALARHEDQQSERLERREQRAELALAVLTLAGAIGLLVASPPRSFSLGLAIALGIALAIARRVKFYDGAGYTVPTQLVFVPMLLLLPAATVPLVVIVALMVGETDRYVRGESHAHRLVLNIGDSIFALGPALVLVIAGVGAPSWHLWPVYLGALVAQFASDFAGAAARDWLVVGLGADLALPLFLWTWLVDALLATVGLLAALAARDMPYGALLVLPLMALLAIFSRERDARIEQSLELSRAYRGTTLLLSDVLDEDDEYTAFHSRGVVQLSIAVAERMELDARQMRNVEFGALLHDIGKIAIPKEILHKPGKLSPDEWVVMKTHTVEGQKLLDRVGGVLGDVGRVVRSSHERWDGGGYPDGLAGEEIPIESAIVCACDAFNAMTTHRPYRRALDPREAVEELEIHRGAQFSPVVVDVLIELIHEDAAMVGPTGPEELPITVAMAESAISRAV
jgi:HD-GYP domain-containing protein (c-di-GMP phosphodiesterase class II)